MGCGSSRTMDMEGSKISVESEFNVKTDPETTMRFLCYAEEYPTNVEPGWEDGKAEIGEVRDGGKSFDVLLTNDAGQKIKTAVISNRKLTDMKYEYHFQYMSENKPLFEIDTIFELSECTEGGTTIKRTNLKFKQRRKLEMPLDNLIIRSIFCQFFIPNKIPGITETQHERMTQLLEEVADGIRDIEGESKAQLPEN